MPCFTKLRSNWCKAKIGKLELVVYKGRRKKFNYHVEIRTRDLSPCNIATKLLPYLLPQYVNIKIPKYNSDTIVMGEEFRLSRHRENMNRGRISRIIFYS
jgi:hypothetical protein